jgi:hypothetical protein
VLKVAIFNTDGEFALSLRNQLQACRDARIVAEVSDPDELIPTVELFNFYAGCVCQSSVAISTGSA